jgi:hypothetical protein
LAQPTGLANNRKAVSTVTDTAKNPEGNDDSERRDERNRPHFRHIENMEAFGFQPTSTSELPDPSEFAIKLVGGIIECVHGLREPIQFTRYVTEDVYKALSHQAHRLAVAQSQKKKKKARPRFTMGNVVVNNPRDGIVEAAVVVHGPARVRAVALRLEGIDQRWKATSFSML